MELQGQKTTHDFLSLCNKEPTPSNQGLFLKTHDFLQPLEGKTKTTEADVADPPTSIEHVLPGGIGTYSISHVPEYAKHAVVKPEWPIDTRAVAAGAHANSHSSSYSRGAFTLWEEPRPSDKAVSGGGVQQWPSSSPYASRISNSSSSFGSLLSTRARSRQDRNRPIDAGSKSGKGFTDEDDDDEDCGKRKGSSQKDLTVKMDGKRNGDQKPTTPRSKHSATEQRRRSKINDRFQILRDLIPRSDQKRDKASFLLEVIEYIQFLQEKSQKYESGYPGWSHENAKLASWKSNQMPVEGIADDSHVIQNGPPPSDFVFSADNAIPVASTMVANDRTTLESENVSSGLANKAASTSVPLQLYGGSSGFVQPHLRLVTDLENAASHSQLEWPRQSSGCGDMLKERDLTIDEGTISISSAYSQGVLHVLAETLQNSGMDLSQASISVQINLGKRAFTRLASNHKDHGDPSSGNQAIAHSRMDSTVLESQQANKRHKTR